MNKTDSELIAASVEGQALAYEALMERYQDRLFHALYQILQNREDVRDVVQQAFVTAWHKLETFRGEAGFYSWLFRIAYNIAMTQQRKKKLKTVSLTPPDRSSIPVPAESLQTQPVDQLELQERQELIRTALASLPEEFRTVLVMKELENFKYEQMAEILNVPLGTIRSRIFRARQLLRDKLIRVLSPEEIPSQVKTT